MAARTDKGRRQANGTVADPDCNLPKYFGDRYGAFRATNPTDLAGAPVSHQCQGAEKFNLPR
jgi:hypothetical protein